MTLLKFALGDRREQAARKWSRLVAGRGAGCKTTRMRERAAKRLGTIRSSQPAGRAERRPRREAGTKGNQPKPWLDPQRMRVADSEMIFPSPPNDCKGVG